MARWSWIWLGWAACTTEGPPPVDAPEIPDVDEPGPVESDTPTTPPDTDVDPPAEDTALPPEDDVDPPVAEPQIVRFVALGDAGEGNSEQYAVGAAIANVCETEGCDFALYLGDNFYDDGVYNEYDEQFETKFELPYADVDFPFYVVLGNHDFGEIPLQFWRTDYQVEYSNISAKWRMPDHFYHFDAGFATFLGLDTNMIMLGLDWTQDQRGWVRRQLRQAQNQRWRIAYGHHPFKSNGPHGNAGNYEGAWYDPTGIVRGALIEDFFRDELCRKIDLYLSGHDHSRQWLEPACGIELIVSGAGAKLTDFEHRDYNRTIWESDEIEGFSWIELRDDGMTVRFYDMNGQLQHEGVVQR